MVEPTAPQVTALYTEPANEITESTTYIDKETGIIMFSPEAAIRLVLNDTEVADNYVNMNQWAAGWILADMLYQSPFSQSSFDGNVGSANVPKFMVSNHINAIVPKIMGGLFYEDPPFLLRPRPKTDPVLVTAKTAVFTSQLEDMGFEEEIERSIEQMALLGTGIMKWGYTEYQKTVKKHVRPKGEKTIQTAAGIETVDGPTSDDFEIEHSTKLISRPWLRFCDIRTVLVNPGCRVGDIRKAGWVVYRDYATYEDLDQLRDVPGYKIPDEDVLKQIFSSAINAGPDNITMTLPEGMMGYLQHALPRSLKTSADPMRTPLEILERWDNEHVIVVLCHNGHNILIRNEANPYQKIPFLSANWRNIPDCFYGQGLGLLIGSEQIVEQGVTNLAIDLLAYGLQPTAVRKKGFQTPTQNIRWGQGTIIDVEDDVEKAFKFLQMPPVPSEAWQFIQQAQVTGASTSGANEQVVQGAAAMGIRSTGMRSGTGAAAVVQANASRLDGPSNRIVRQIFVPWLYQMDELDNDLMPTSVIRQTLDDELEEELKFDHIDYREAKIEYEVLAGANLGPKKEMAQFLPILIQLMNNPTFTQNVNDSGYDWNGVAVFKNLADMAGWKFSQNFLTLMSPERKAQHQANSPAALQQAQIAAQKQSQLAQFQHDQQIEQMKQLGKAGNEAMRHSLEQATTPGLEGGETTRGYGAETQL